MLVRCIVLILFIWPLAEGAQYIGYSDYQIVTDRSFDASGYFREMQANGVNLQRIWVMGYSNSSTFIPEQMPFCQREGQSDLNCIDPGFLKHLRDILSKASQHDQRVLLTLFDRWSLADEKVYALSPWSSKNNWNHALRNPLPDFYDVKNPRLMKIQENFVQQIVSATAEFRPIYEIMNEAGWRQDCGLIERWHDLVAGWILHEDPSVDIAVSLAYQCPRIFAKNWVRLISFHFDDWQQTGICKLLKKYNGFQKNLMIDTDGAWRIRDDNRLVRKWLKETMRCGGSFNHKDDIYHLDREVLRAIQTEHERSFRN